MAIKTTRSFLYKSPSIQLGNTSGYLQRSPLPREFQGSLDRAAFLLRTLFCTMISIFHSRHLNTFYGHERPRPSFTLLRCLTLTNRKDRPELGCSPREDSTPTGPRLRVHGANATPRYRIHLLLWTQTTLRCLGHHSSSTSSPLGVPVLVGVFRLHAELLAEANRSYR